VGYRVVKIGEAPSSDAVAIFEDFDRPRRQAGEAEIELYVAASRPVDPDVEGTARAALTAATVDLGLIKRRPRLLWFRPAAEALTSHVTRDELKDLGLIAFEHPAIHGIAHRAKDAIAVDATLAPEDVVEVVAHEIFHLAARGFDGDDEPAAKAYGERFHDAFRDVLPWMKHGVPQVHEDTHAPGHTNVLYGVAETGDILRAPNRRRTVSVAYVNVGSKQSPSWRRVS
jgi:hypothetical protein